MLSCDVMLLASWRAWSCCGEALQLACSRDKALSPCRTSRRKHSHRGPLCLSLIERSIRPHTTFPITTAIFIYNNMSDFGNYGGSSMVRTSGHSYASFSESLFALANCPLLWLRVVAIFKGSLRAGRSYTMRRRPHWLPICSHNTDTGAPLSIFFISQYFNIGRQQEAKKQQVMDQVRSELALANAQELINVRIRMSLRLAAFRRTRHGW